MKVILAGPTGFIGCEVLEQCLQHSFITSIVALSRRELPSSVSSNPKVKVAIMNDYLSYPESVLQDIKGAEACIWYSQPVFSLSLKTTFLVSNYQDKGL